MSTLTKTNNAFSITVECIRHNDSLNLTWGMNKFLSITGTCVVAEGFIQDDEDLSPYLLKTKTVLCFTEEMGNAVLESTQAVFNSRMESGERNPVIAIKVSAHKLGQVADGHLVLEIVSAEVIDVEFPAFNATTFKQRALGIKVKTTEANIAALEETQSNRPIVRARTVEVVSQTTAAIQSQRVVGNAKPVLRSL